MLCLKGCPRCGGDLYENADNCGRYLVCLQCGHNLTAAEEEAVRYSRSALSATYRSGLEAGFPASAAGPSQ